MGWVRQRLQGLQRQFYSQEEQARLAMVDSKIYALRTALQNDETSVSSPRAAMFARALETFAAKFAKLEPNAKIRGLRSFRNALLAQPVLLLECLHDGTKSDPAVQLLVKELAEVSLLNPVTRGEQAAEIGQIFTNCNAVHNPAEKIAQTIVDGLFCKEDFRAALRDMKSGACPAEEITPPVATTNKVMPRLSEWRAGHGV